MLRRHTSIVATVAAFVCILIFAGSNRPGATSVSEETLLSTFDSDIRNVVLQWAPEDSRPAAERQQALFDFIYQTYDSSAWIPQSLFDRNLVTQAVVGSVDTIVRDKVGLVLWRDNGLVPAFGMAPNRTPRGASAPEPLRWTVNCLVCHTAEIDGVAYFGAGTKTFDDKFLGEALKLLTGDRLLPITSRGPADRHYAADANRILNSHHHEKIDSLTRGRSTAFAASHVELYMRPNNGRMPEVHEVGRGDAKTPPLWHTAAKLPVGRWYTDGSFHGAIPLMASSMELEKDRSFDALVDSVIPRIKQEFGSVIRHLRPPPYPYAVDASLAEEGRRLFYSKSVGCARCHGVYDGKGNVGWPGVHTDVGTDLARRDIVSAAFVEAFRNSPIAEEG